MLPKSKAEVARGVARALLSLVAVASLRLPAQAVLVTRVASGLDRPLFVVAPPGDNSRLFIVEQHTGKILILNLPGLTLNPTPFLTLTGLSTGSEQGLLGLAFHPSYASNGFFYVDYTRADGTTRIARYTVSGDPNVANAASAQLILEIAQPQSNHNGGWLGFGPDGYLYVASGDGGNSNDTGSGHTEPGGNSQDTTNNLLGKILRLDVNSDGFPGDPARNYAIPADNPFVGTAGDDEIWVYGLRNPWRCSFDRLTGDFYIGDVGQNAREEIDVQPASSSGGENYGWRLREGIIQTPGGVGGAQPAGGINPIYEYEHGDGNLQGYSTTGGYVYRGPAVPLQGHYFFADYVTERIWSLKWDGANPSSNDATNFTEFTDRTAELVPNVGSINEVSSFGEDADGNLYIVDLGGEVFRIGGAPELGPTDPFFFYKVAGNAAAPAFDSFGPITLTDQFRSVQYNVYKPFNLGLPANQNGAGVNDADTHLEEYKLKAADGTAAFSRVADVTVVNTCNTLLVTVTKPLSLLVPTAKSLLAPPAAPDPLVHDLDHLLCYRAKAQTKLPKRMQVDVVDQFQSRRYDLKKVTKLCAPVAKIGSPLYLEGTNQGMPKVIEAATIQNPDDHLLCYKATLARRSVAQSGCLPVDPNDAGSTIEPSQTRHTPQIGVYVNNQFGSGRLDSKKEVELCLPSATILP